MVILSRSVDIHFSKCYYADFFGYVLCRIVVTIGADGFYYVGQL